MRFVDSISKLFAEREKRSRLDSMLLILPSFFSLFFAMISYMGGVRWVHYFLFLVPAGLVMPVYVGYWRGTIAVNTITERIRGWIYLTIGCSHYVGMTLSLYLFSLFMPGWEGPATFALMPVLIPYLTIFPLSWHWLPTLHELYGLEMGVNAGRSYACTSVSAASLSFLLALLAVSFDEKNWVFYSWWERGAFILSLGILFVLSLFILFCYLEVKARRVTSAHQTPYDQPFER